MKVRVMEPASTRDIELVEEQLGRAPRGEMQIAHRCPCGAPDVVRTTPRLADGTPFPTLYYATCPRLAGAIGTLEASGLMREMEQRLAADIELAAKYSTAHEQYLADRRAIAQVAELAAISAGGMPDRVKCLHVLAAHSLAVGLGVNPLGDEVLAALAPWWTRNPCGDHA
ncbi:hypothetical protein LBMAG15_00170 [Actinomycetes bacterium]|nr:hypothetical protein LBMAG15_00170 [Actinomycetes bacterium]